MQINTKIRYGLRAMMEIGSHDSKHGVFQKDIAKNQQLSDKYLDSIIASLKASGLIRNAAGKKSGYVLTKSPKDIRVLDIYVAFETSEILQCICNPMVCDRSRKCVARDYWTGLNEVIVKYLSKKTLADLIRIDKKMKKDG